MAVVTTQQNPARALYRHWRRVLEDSSFATPMMWHCAYGPLGGWLHVRDHDDRGRPVIALGRYSTALLIIAPDGSFKITTPWGSSQTRILTNWTFLDMSYGFSTRHWYVKEPWQQGSTYLNIEDHTLRVPYVSERGHLPCCERELWWRLEPHATRGWQISPADQTNPDIADAWERHTALREKRWKRSERRAQGVKPRPKRPPTPLSDHMVAIFAAAFDLSEPACETRPTHRGPKEAHTDGDHLARQD